MRFAKMHGCGNDFVVVTTDALPAGADPRALGAAICRSGTGVGADGLAIVDARAADAADFAVAFVNRSGLPAEMCGNAARCIARFAADRGIAGAAHRFATAAGIVGAEVAADAVRITLPPPGDLARDLAVEAEGAVWRLDAIEVGVPHAVLWWEGDIESAPVDRLGRALRHASAFPRGSNVSFAAPRGGLIRMRTFERGVEAETLACGTGAAAVAISASARGLAVPPVRLRTSEGGILTVGLRTVAGRVEDLTLEGPTAYVFEGELSDAWLRRALEAGGLTSG